MKRDKTHWNSHRRQRGLGIQSVKGQGNPTLVSIYSTESNAQCAGSNVRALDTGHCDAIERQSNKVRGKVQGVGVLGIEARNVRQECKRVVGLAERGLEVGRVAAVFLHSLCSVCETREEHTCIPVL